MTGDQLIGRVLGDRFTIREQIGRGGMGAVYRAVQTSTGREVAVKVIAPGRIGDRNAEKRFLREAKLSADLGSPHTVTVFDYGRSDDGTLYIAMELVAGRSLDDVIAREAPLPQARVVGIGTQLCDALTAAHSKSIVHRDLKPPNIMILDSPPGRDFTKVLDFGLAKSLARDLQTLALTRSDDLIGTPIYLAPETIGGGPFSPASDLYAVGVILYELASGGLPFGATTVQEMLACHLKEQPKPLPESVPAGLRAVIARLLAKDPGQRFASARDLRQALIGLGSEHVTPPRPPTGRWKAVVIGAALVAALATVIVLAVGGDSTSQPDAATPIAVVNDAASAVPASAVPHDAAVPDAAPPGASVPDAAPKPKPKLKPKLKPKPKPKPKPPQMRFVIRTVPPGARVTFSGPRKVTCPEGTRVCRFSIPLSDSKGQLGIFLPGYQGLLIAFPRGRLSEAKTYEQTFKLEK